MSSTNRREARIRAEQQQWSSTGAYCPVRHDDVVIWVFNAEKLHGAVTDWTSPRLEESARRAINDTTDPKQ